MHPVVSVCVPCYNVAPYIGKFLDSLLSQTYKNLQVILVNDGSTDETAALIEEYLPRLRAEGYETLMIHQENGGQAAAIQTGIRAATGTFLTWPDPDDWMTPDSIEKRVCFLEEHPDVAMVRGNVEQIEYGSGRSLGTLAPIGTGAHPIHHFFRKIIHSDTWLVPICSMIRLIYLDAEIPNRDIYVSRQAGQNFQLLLPIAWKYPCRQMEEVLGFYLIRPNSHSRNTDTLQKRLAYCDMCEDVLLQTLSRIPWTEAFAMEVRCKYVLKRLTLARRAKDKEALNRIYRHSLNAPELIPHKKLIRWYRYAPSPLIRLGESIRKRLRYHS